MKSQYNFGDFGAYYIYILPFGIRKLRKVIPFDAVKKLLYQRYNGELPPAVDETRNTLEDQARISIDLIVMGEYSLQQWAIANHIQEAYRLTIIPSWETEKLFSIRLFKTPKNFHIIVRLGRGRSPVSVGNVVPSLPPSSRTHSIKASQWLKFSDFMKAHFWSSENWFTFSGYDGTDFYFEGWHNEKYRLLYDWSPDGKRDNNAAYEATQLLQTIVDFDMSEYM